MSSLQPGSVKISKQAKNNSKSNMTFICGGCSKTYQSYPALYLHIKRKHGGIRPPNTKISKPAQPMYVGTAQTGRPSKPLHNVDDVSFADLCLEETQNELLGFLGERLSVVSGFEDKFKLEEVVNRINSIPKENKDKWFTGVQSECQALFAQHGEKMNLDFEEEFRNLNPENGFRVLVWFLLWLSKHFIKKDFIPELAIVVSKIYKVLDQTQLQIQDLDNKLVWKKAMTECKLVLSDLPSFKRDDDLVYEFIQKVCQLIGKAFEQASS